MYNRNTVFILGAGASWHYGYPTGEILVHEVRRFAVELSNYCNGCAERSIGYAPKFIARDGLTKDRWREWRDIFSKVSLRIDNADPLVIDYFLSQNPDLREAVTFLIAWVILRREALYRSYKNRENRTTESHQRTNDNWVRFIAHKRVQTRPDSSALSQNRVNFITFNYDYSLEQALIQSLDSLSYLRHSDIVNFMSEQRIVHMYGQVRYAPYSTDGVGGFSVVENPLALFGNSQAQHQLADLMDKVYNASREINVIEIGNKDDNSDNIQVAQEILAKATDLYFLGYGFDENNNKRLGLDRIVLRSQGGPHLKINYTNYQDSNRINKIAGSLFIGNQGRLISPGGQSTVIQGHIAVEKSIKNTYDALLLDFDH